MLPPYLVTSWLRLDSFVVEVKEEEVYQRCGWDPVKSFICREVEDLSPLTYPTWVDIPIYLSRVDIPLDNIYKQNNIHDTVIFYQFFLLSHQEQLKTESISCYRSSEFHTSSFISWNNQKGLDEHLSLFHEDPPSTQLLYSSSCPESLNRFSFNKWRDT